MKFDRYDNPEEFWDLAVDFVTGWHGIKQGKDWAHERLSKSTKPVSDWLPKTHTRDNPYPVNVDDNLFCNIWFEDDRLTAGGYYVIDDETGEIFPV